MILRKAILLLMLLILQGLHAQVEFKAAVSRSKIGIDETVRITFTMNQDGDNFLPPDFKGFTATGPEFSVGQFKIDPTGKRTRGFSKTAAYTLTPNKKGTFSIGAASIEIEGRVYKSQPVKIVVGEAVHTPGAITGADIPKNPGSGIFLVAEVSNTSPYFNEGINVLYKLYVGYGKNDYVSDFKTVPESNYIGFWSQGRNIPRAEQKLQTGLYKGKAYRYVVLREAVLYPQKEGRLEISPATVKVDTETPTGRFNAKGEEIFLPAHKQVASQVQYVNVKPLPGKGRPGDFAGAVGKFDFKVSPSATTSNGEPITVEVIASGKGNLKLFTLPKLKAPEGLEIYDPQHKENVSIPLSGMEGSISDAYMITPRTRGKFPVKGLSFSWFDPSVGEYRTIGVKDIMIEVPDMSASGNRNDAAQFRAIALATTLRDAEREDFFGSVLFYLLLLGPFLLIPVVILAKNKKDAYDSDEKGNRQRQTSKLTKEYLSEARKQIGNKEAFYLSLEKALHNFLKAKLGIETSDLSRDKISELLLSRKVTSNVVNDFMKIIDNCEFARYAPSSGTAMEEDYNEAMAVVTIIEKQL